MIYHCPESHTNGSVQFTCILMKFMTRTVLEVIIWSFEITQDSFVLMISLKKKMKKAGIIFLSWPFVRNVETTWGNVLQWKDAGRGDQFMTRGWLGQLLAVAVDPPMPLNCSLDAHQEVETVSIFNHLKSLAVSKSHWQSKTYKT